MEQNELAVLVARYARSEGDFVTDIPELHFYRRNRVSAPLPCVYGLGLGIGIQGKKVLVVGTETFEVGPGDSMLTMMDMPVVSQISEATPSKPFLGTLITLDSKLISQVMEELPLVRDLRSEAQRGVSLQPLDNGLREATWRLIHLLEEAPAIQSHVAPLILREVCIRLLLGPHGPKLRRVVSTDSSGQHIAKAVSWLKHHFRENIHIDDLASSANMSPSVFRRHFRATCGVSPVQFQKRLRLNEARQILASEKVDARAVASLVGYESVSQFSREYRRLFGNPPLRDAKVQRNLSMRG